MRARWWQWAWRLRRLRCRVPWVRYLLLLELLPPSSLLLTLSFAPPLDTTSLPIFPPPPTLSIALDALGRLPPFFFEVVQRGPEDVLAKDLSTLPSALAALAQFHPEKAAYYRGILQGRADGATEAPSYAGVPEVITEANKHDVVRRDCEEVLLRRSGDAWALIRKGFLQGGGRVVLECMAAAGVPSLRPLVYDPLSRERRTAFSAQQREQATRDGEFVQRMTRPCPSCGAACTKDEACMHVTCDACGSAWNWCCRRVQAGHPSHSCPNGGDMTVQLRLR